MLGVVTDLELSLITDGFTIAGVLVTFGGSYMLDRARDRRAAGQSRDSAIADLITTSVELVLAVNTIRAAYQHKSTRGFRCWSMTTMRSPGSPSPSPTRNSSSRSGTSLAAT